MTSETEAFDAIVRSLRARPGVTVATMFGAPGLRISGKVFATLYKGDLVLKLSSDRVQELIGSRDAVLFDPGHGRVSKEWVALKPRLVDRWAALAREALEFVSVASKPVGRGKGRRRK